MSEDREVTIKIVGKNLTAEEFNAARVSLSGLKKSTDDTGKSSDTLGQKLLGAKSSTALFDDQIKKFVAGFTIAALVEKAAGAVVDWTAQTYDNASALVKQNAATGVSIEMLSKWAIVAHKADVDQGAFAAGAYKFGIAMTAGGQDVQKALSDIGLSYDDLKNQRPEEQFDAVMRALGRQTDEGRRNAAGAALLGLSYKELSPAIASYGSQMDKARGLTADQTRALHEQHEALDEVSTFISGRFSSSLGDLAVTMKTVHDQGFGPVLKALWESKGQSDEYNAAISRMRAETNRLTEDQKAYIKTQVDAHVATDIIVRSVGAGAEGVAAYADSLRGPVKAAQVDYVTQLKLQQAAIRSLTVDERTQIDAAMKSGATNDEIAKQYPKLAGAVDLYKQQLADARKKIDEVTSAEEALRKVHEARVAEMTGVTLQKAIADESAAFVESTKAKQLNGYQTDELMKKINTFIEQGGRLTPELHEFYLAHLNWNLGIDQSVASLDKLLAKMPQLTSKPFVIPVKTLFTLPSQADGMEESVFQHYADIGKKASVSFGKSFSDYMQTGFPVALMGAITGGGSKIEAIGSSLGGFLVSDAGMGKSLTKGLTGLFGDKVGKAFSAALPGIGALVGPALDALINKFFKGNTTKEGREDFAADMGLSLDALYKKLESFGPQGQRLANTALNVIGKHDEAANRAWMQEVTAFFDAQKQKEQDVADAATAAAEQKKSAIDSVTDKLRTQLTELDQRRQSLMDSIANEAPEEVMGIVEAQTRAQIASIDAQKASLQEQIDNVEDAGESAIDSISHTAQETYKEIARQWQAGLVIPYSFQAQNGPDPSVSGIPHYASGGIAQGRQMAVIAERGRREIVGDVAFMTDAVTGAFNRIGMQGMRGGAGGGGDKFFIVDGAGGGSAYETSDSAFIERYNRLMAAKQLRVTLDSLVERVG
jgi:hypothetical protein